MTGLLAILIVPATLCASTSTAWEMNTYNDFLKGRFSGVSLSKEGRLSLAPRLETIFSSDQPAIWAVVRAAEGTIYAGSGHRGRVYRIEPSGKSSLYWTSDQPEVFALALDSQGKLYAGTSPDGKVYRIENGKALEYFAPGAKYIWSLGFDSDGVLYVGTGDQGKVFRVPAAGKGELYYSTGQSHVTALAFDRERRLLAGTEPNGILYRIFEKDKAFVLYDANLPEIRTIVSASDGTIYAAALGGTIARRTGPAITPLTPGGGIAPVVGPATTITVTDENAQAGVELKPRPDPAKPQVAPQVTAAVAPLVDYSGVVEKSAIYRIHPDNTVETLWSSKDENVYDLLAAGGRITFSTDGQGRIYALDADRKLTLMAQTNEGETVRLLDSPAGLLAATGNLGKLYRLGSDGETSGWFESPVHDSGSVARWGRLDWRGESRGLVFRTRSGNSARPDRTWSEWSKPLASPDAVLSPNARYVQWRAEFSSARGAAPVLETVTLAYLPQNTPPVVRSVNVSTQAATGAQQTKTPAAATPPAATYSITVTDTGEAGASTATGTPTQTITRGPNQQLQISWQADDPDGDRLIHAVYFRGEEEREWKLLRGNLAETQFGIDADVLADGKYFFRVVASDRVVNPPQTARDAELVSAPVLIDNTPPALKAAAPRREGTQLVIEVDASDASSPMRRCEYSVDAGPWTPVEAADGVTDSRRERFILRVDNLAPREHLIVIRGYDAAGNAGLAKILVR
jgi:outer membrane protein assembly factor BamB